MTGILRILITDTGRHWHKRIWLFGIPVYHRHDYTHRQDPKTIGFNTLPCNPIDIEDQETED